MSSASQAAKTRQQPDQKKKKPPPPPLPHPATSQTDPAATSATSQQTITPAQLGFLAIYNPSLGTTDETIDDQIVYYATIESLSPSSSSKGKNRRRRRVLGTGGGSDGDDRNERLRQVGLAQGMVEFGRSFSGGRAVDVVETVGSRVVLHELEPGWWVLASIDLTRLPVAGSKSDTAEFEYSSREVKPAALLLQDLLRAHSVFLLHHASSLSALFVRTQRDRFVTVLGRYWDLFLSTWNVLLHGNPACGVFGGIKVAACGELGIGVGEEERGSGERDFFEGLVGRVEGLVDLVVGRFAGDDSDTKGQWLGSGDEPGAEDGAVFLGVGAVSRPSLRAIACWMEDMYTWGDNAYGVADRPSSTRRKRRARGQAKAAGEERAGVDAQSGEEGGGIDKIFNYLKLGYGTSWSLGNTTSQETKEGSAKPEDTRPDESEKGRFLIGLTGDIDTPAEEQDSAAQQDSDNARTMVRTLSVELESDMPVPESQVTRDFGSQDTELAEHRVDAEGNIVTNPAPSTITAFSSQDRNKTAKLRVVVYAARPFLFVLLFEPRTDSLAWEGMYRSLHSQLFAVRKGLLASTAYRPERPDSDGAGAEIYDLVWDPRALTVHSTVPNIPDPFVQSKVWTRVEALGTHAQILGMFAATRSVTGTGSGGEAERTCKTSRGWWVVWSRILERASSDSAGVSDCDEDSESGEEDEETDSEDEEKSEKRGKGVMVVSKEIFLVRRASDNTGGGIGAGLRSVHREVTV
ncbi:hypothetical protein QBC47DRAFT_365182 [Echria macrotheca]|uniref:CCZ1/INTU/HSP4 first Longin domain-containing protein n=1 Tax=Echria macrotheca TaxID=438768 RepID=A0AAJ0B2P7_9PEZI|nr:hypothetical protein QBC47DRAFT_365182 [Echria macrotheca]